MYTIDMDKGVHQMARKPALIGLCGM
jgi:hypothetical protein